jgi:hypothetical protein
MSRGCLEDSKFAAIDNQMIIQRRFEKRRTYSFANTPLKAAHAPLAMAKMIHCDFRLRLDKSISLSSAWLAWGFAGSGTEGEESRVL